MSNWHWECVFLNACNGYLKQLLAHCIRVNKNATCWTFVFHMCTLYYVYMDLILY